MASDYIVVIDREYRSRQDTIELSGFVTTQVSTYRFASMAELDWILNRDYERKRNGATGSPSRMHG